MPGKRWFRALAAATLLVAGVCPGAFGQAAAGKSKPAASADPELARVGTTSIRQSDFIAAYENITPANRPVLDTREQRAEFLENLVNREIMLAAAKEQKLDEDPYFLQSTGAFRDGVIEPLLMNALVRGTRRPTEDDVDAMAERLNQRYHLHLLLTPDSARIEEAAAWLAGGKRWAEAEEMWRRLDYGEYEDTDTETPEIIPYEIRDPLFALQPGEWSGILRVAGDYHIVYLESRDPLTRDGEEMRETARQVLEDDRKRRAMNTLIDEYRAREAFRIIEPEVRKIARRFREAAAPRTRPGSDLMRWPDVKPEEAGVSLAEWAHGRVTLREFLFRLADYPTEARPDLGSEHQVRLLVSRFAASRFRDMEAEKRGLLGDSEAGDKVRKNHERTLLRMLLEQVVQANTITIPEDSVRAWYEANKAQLQLPEEYRVNLLVAPDSASAALYFARITAGEDLGKLARANSVHRESADRGGDLGWVTADAYPELHDALVATRRLNLAPPVKALGGWAMLHVADTRGSRTARIEEVRSMAQQQLTIRERDRRFKAWLANQKQQRKVVTFADRLAGIQVPG